MPSVAQIQTALQYPPATVVWTLYVVGGSSYELPVKSWSINRSRREPLDWSISLPMSTALKPGGSIGQYLRPEPYDATWTLRRYLQCVITVGSDTWTSPKLVLQNRRFKIVDKERVFTCSGNDRTEALLEEDTVMSDVRSVPAGLVLCSTVTNETCTAQGITSVSHDYTDFYVKTFHRTGVPISYLRQLWEVFQGCIEWVGDTFRIYTGGNDVGAMAVDYSLSENAHIIVLDYQDASENAVNEVTVERVSELKNALVEPIIGKGLGFQSVGLAQPMTYCVVRIVLDNPGAAINGVFDDSTGTPLTSAPTFVYRGSVPATTFRFELDPPVGSGPFPADIQYRVFVVGEEHNTSLGDYSSSVSATYKSDYDQGKRGKKKLPQPITMAHVPSQARALDAATRKVREGLLAYQTAQIQAPLQPLVKPGQIASVTASDVGLSAHKMMTQTVAFAGDPDSLLMTVGLGRELT